MSLFGKPSIEKLQRKGDVRGLIKRLDSEKDKKERLAIAEAIDQLDLQQSPAKLGTPLIDLLIARMEDPHETDFIREVSVKMLGHLGGPQAIEPLVRALIFSQNLYSNISTRNIDISKAAGKALVQIGPPAVDSLIAELQNDRIWPEVPKVLGEIGDIRLVTPLFTLLTHKVDSVRAASARALGQMGDQSAVQPLVAVLGDSDRMVRRAAAAALGEIGDTLAVQPLSALVNDEDDLVLEAAAGALRKIGDPQANKALADYDLAIKGYLDEGELAKYELLKTSLGKPLNLEVITEKHCVYCKHLREPNMKDSEYPKGVGDCMARNIDTGLDESCEKWKPNQKVRFWLSKGYMENNREGLPRAPWYQLIDDGPDGEKGTR